MTAVALGVAVALVLLMGGSLVRVAIGPTDADRMLGLQLLGSGLTAVALVLAEALAMPPATRAARTTDEVEGIMELGNKVRDIKTEQEASGWAGTVKL